MDHCLLFLDSWPYNWLSMNRVCDDRNSNLAKIDDPNLLYYVIDHIKHYRKFILYAIIFFIIYKGNIKTF